MICPKCGFEQPDSPECARCGILVAGYRGPYLGAGALRPSASPAAGGEAVGGAPPPQSTGAGMGGMVSDPTLALPAMAALPGTAYDGSPPGTVGVFRGTFGVGEILRDTFSVYFSNLLPFVLLTALALSPLYLLLYFKISTPAASPLSLFFPVLGVALAILSSNIATGAITYGVFQQMRGRDASVAECLSRGVSLLLPLLGLAIVQSFVIGLGLAACIIPGIVVAVRWSVSIPAAVTEGTGVSASIERSSFLTDGLRWDVFGVLFALGVLQIGFSLLVNLVAKGNPGLHLLLTAVKDLLVVGLSATGSAVMYYRLRSIKESIDVDQIASVFT